METQTTGQEQQEQEGAILAEFTKNTRGEVVRVRRFDFKGHDMVDVRQWYPAAGGELRPGKGLALRTEQLPDLIAALGTAAAAVGLAEDGEG